MREDGKESKMLRIYLSLFGLVLTVCGQSVAQSIPNKPPAGTTENAVPPAPTPPVAAPLSECSLTRAQNLPAGVNIPQELCFDAAKPVDARERSRAKVGNSPQSATIEETALPFEKLPAEVRKIVVLTAPEMNTTAVVFDLTTITTPDEKSNNHLVKSYRYASASKAKSAGADPNRHSWLFKRQGNRLKLENAELTAAAK